MTEHVYIGALLITNLLQFWFWSRQNQKLVDKIMSGSYANYVQSQTVARPTARTPEVEDLQIEDTDILRELNRALPS